MFGDIVCLCVAFVVVCACRVSVVFAGFVWLLVRLFRLRCFVCVYFN